MRPAGSKKALRVKINFMFAFKAIISVQPCCEIIILFFRTCGCLGSFRLIEERRFAIVTDVEAGCGGRVGVAARIRTTSMRTVKSQPRGFS
jgi:hypothetical protein